MPQCIDLEAVVVTPENRFTRLIMFLFVRWMRFSFHVMVVQGKKTALLRVRPSNPSHAGWSVGNVEKIDEKEIP